MDRNRIGMVEISQMSDMLKAAQQRYDNWFTAVGGRWM